MRELRGEDSRAPAATQTPRRAEASPGNRKQRLEERRQGHPPPWAPTIFVRKPEDIEVARRLWRIRAGLRTR
jgi:hypothetical protein